MTNPKIKRKKSDIAKTEAQLAELKNKLREQKQELINLENEEVIALFRRENFNEDEFFTLLKSTRKSDVADELLTAHDGGGGHNH